MTDLGEAQNYLGVEIHRQQNGMFLSQQAYIQKLLDKFQMRGCNSTRLPIDPKMQLSCSMGTPKTNLGQYRSLVGSLIYLSHTRPDISYAVSSLARYMQDPETAHLQAAKKVLRYLSGTEDHGILLDSSSDATLYSYADVDWGKDIDTRRSISGTLHRIGDSSIAWTSKMQPTVSLSSIEAEYRVLTNAAKDIIHFRRLFNELGIRTNMATPLFSDNQSCIKLVDNPVMYARTKHIEIQQHFIREIAQAGKIQVNHIPTTAQLADFLMKPLSYGSFIENRQRAGVIPKPQN